MSDNFIAFRECVKSLIVHSDNFALLLNFLWLAQNAYATLNPLPLPSPPPAPILKP